MGNKEHRMRRAFLSAAGFPVLRCSCGQEFHALTWQHAGQFLDDHLYEANLPQSDRGD